MESDHNMLFLTFYFVFSLQFYLPPEPLVNKDFLKAILAGKKHLLRKVEVDYI